MIFMRVYVVDNGGQWTHREWRVLKYLGIETKIIPNNTPPKDLDVDALVLSGGSPHVSVESDKMGLNSEYIDSLNIPILGICAGFQFMCNHLGADLRPAEIPESHRFWRRCPRRRSVPGTAPFRHSRHRRWRNPRWWNSC